MRFSSRTPADLTPSALASVLAGSNAATDLTVSNPTETGLVYDAAAIRSALAGPAVLDYDPQPFGHPSARAAVVDYLARIGRPVANERLVLTASTSEGYGALFKLLCDPGDLIAVPAPSYPLVPHLAELEAVGTTRYWLRYDRRWRIDLESAEAALGKGARALVVVSPNNPTGNALTPAERQSLAAACTRHGAALIIDEVFAPYGLDGRPLPSAAPIDGGPLTFVLDGLSKSAALPQIKLGWIAVHGPEAEANAALGRLEWLLDAYLSLSTPAQVAAPALLATAGAMQAQIGSRLRTNRALLEATVNQVAGTRLLAADGGWYAVVELPAGVDEEATVTALAATFGVRVQPGFFYDFEEERYLVVSLLVEPARFAAGVEALGRGLSHIVRLGMSSM